MKYISLEGYSRATADSYGVPCAQKIKPITHVGSRMSHAARTPHLARYMRLPPLTPMINFSTFGLCRIPSLEGVERQNDGYGPSN